MTKAKTEAKGFRFPMFGGLFPIKGSQVPTEIIAGITLAALAIPEVMGYTKISGTPVITGLYTILIPMALYAIFGSSRHLVVGADSATAAILAAGLVGLASVRSDEYVALAGVLAILVAAFLLLARIARLGFLADFLSSTVLVGFLTGVGIQVAFGQVGGMLGLEVHGHGTLGKILADLQHIGETNFYALGIALAVLVLIVGLKRISPKIPGALIAVIGALVVSWALDLQSHGVHVLGAIPSGLPSIAMPHIDWSWDLIQKLLPIAFAMFVVILAQSAATSRAFASRYNERFSENTDLVGLGMANIGAGLSGTFVVAGSPTKTQMVDGAGGRTQLTHLTTVLVVLLVLLFLTGPLSYMPEAVLAAIVFLIGLDLIDLKGMKQIFVAGPLRVLGGPDHHRRGGTGGRRARHHPRHGAVAARPRAAGVSPEELPDRGPRGRRLAQRAGQQPRPVRAGAHGIPVLPQHVLRQCRTVLRAGPRAGQQRRPAPGMVLYRRRRDRRRGLLGGGQAALQLRHPQGEGHPSGLRDGQRGRQGPSWTASGSPIWSGRTPSTPPAMSC